MKLSLRFIAGPSRGKAYELSPGEYVLGRHPECDVYAPDAGVSRQHSRLFCEDKDWYIEDLGSQNGTFVNGHRVQRYRLHDKDVLWVSSHRVQVNFIAASAESGSNVTLTQWKAPVYVTGGEPTAEVAVAARDTDLNRKLSGLKEILEAAAKTAEPAKLIEQLVAKLLDVFDNADSVGVLVEDQQTKQLEIKHLRVRSGDAGDLSIPMTLVDNVVHHRRGILLEGDNHAPSEDSLIDGKPTGSLMGAPILAHDVTYGVLYVDCSEGSFAPDDVELLTGVAAQAGLALHFARMHQELVKRDRVAHDVRLARQIQRSLLPDAPPDIIGLDIAAHYESAFEVGGDFYDFIWHDNDHLGIVIGDVCGKAMSAALYMARLTGELRSRTGIAQTPRRLLRQVNEALLELGDDGMFATILYAVFDFKTRSMVFTNAGHMPPLLRRDGRVNVVHAESAHVPPLGIIPAIEFGEATIQLQVDDVLLLSTDGVHEARNPAGVLYGERRLARSLRRARGASADVVHTVLSDVASHTGDGTQRDDVTLLVMRIGDKRARRRRITRVDEVPPSRANTREPS